VLERCLNELRYCHETLRVSFEAVSGQPRQVIAPPRPRALPVVDLRALAPQLRRDQGRRVTARAVRRPFDLSRRPLLVAFLLHFDDHQLLVLNMHHIISDGWSIDVMMRELALLYHSFSAGRPSPLPELPIQYADFAHWQRQWLQGEALATLLAFWRRQLAGSPAFAELPSDRPRPAIQKFRGANHYFSLPATLSAALSARSRRHRVSIFMLMLAAFETLLYRWSGNRDLTVATPVANRNRIELEGIIGFFTNTLVMRAELTGGRRFADLLTATRELVLAAHAHQDLPFEMLVDELEPERSLSYGPLAQVALSMLHTAVPLPALPGLSWKIRELSTGTAKFDLTLYLWEDTTYSTFAVIAPGAAAEPAIGRPVAATRSWLLDGRLRPVAIGAVAELYLSGRGLARGYQRRPALTAERFLPDPFSGEHGERMYRTGDLARYRRDGNLEFLGRADHQIKLRGYRIELGEIETVLRRHQAVRDAAVAAAAGTTPDSRRLVAYVVLAGGERESAATDSLRYLISNAETLPVALARRWLQRFPQVPLLNTYGATECSDDTTHLVMTAPPAPAPRVAVGRPIAGLRIYVVDRRRRLVAIGSPGQIAMAGIGVGRGYLGDPRKTARTFVPNPFATAAGQRLYLTGDLGRWRPAGELEFLGRYDDQVKVRGHRIELGEVERALAELPGIRQAAVKAWPDDAGSTRLAAYLVAESELDVRELQSRLRRRLPVSMVPEHWLELAVMPLTPHGKIDRRRLPHPETASEAAVSGAVAPRNQLEAQIAAVWQEVLEIDRVGVEDDFFALGGHSLKTIRIRSRLHHTLGVKVPLRTLFDHPTVAELAPAVASLMEGGAAQEAIVRLGEAEHYALSPAQRRLWLRHSMAPQSPVYNMLSVFEIAAAVDPALLQRALATLVDRHESLRTCFEPAAGEPVQRILRRRAVSVPVVDLSALPAEAATAVRLYLARREYLTPFDLTAPPQRLKLLKAAADRHFLLWNLHHIVTDGWSWGILGGELELLYQAFARGEASPLEPPAIRYVDYAAWHHQMLRGERLAVLEKYWLRKLGGELGVAELPTDRPRPPLRTFAAGKEIIRLDDELTAGLRQLSRACDTTLFTALLAATKAFVHRISGQRDLIVGTTAAGRDRVELERVVGFFVATLVLRTDLSGDPPFGELLQRVRQTTVEAYEHQDYPFDLLVERLNPVRDPSRSPLFSVLVDFMEGLPADQIGERFLQPDPLGVELSNVLASDFDLEIHFLDHGGRLSCFLRYSTALFDERTIRRLSGHWRTLLASLTASPEARLSQLRLLSAAEHRQVVADFNATARALPPETCVHQLFEKQVARTPEAVAAVFGEEQLSYQALNERANRLSHHLRALGVGPEALVGICLGHCLETLVCVLGVLKAGGAYLPVDPHYPRARIRFMLTAAGASVVLTAEKLRQTLPELAAQNVAVDGARFSLACRSAENPPPAARGENPAYAIFTSGSTGQPKGVQITHRALVNFLWAMKREPGLASRDVLLAVTSLSFDISVLELLLPLMVGARVVIARREVVADGALLSDLLHKCGATVMQATPAGWHMLLLAGWQGEARLKALCGGESLPPELAARLRPRTESLWNLYGPTETTVWSTTCEIGESDAAVPIGHPIANTRVLIVDRHANPVPVGVVGHLHVGGPLPLARGYLGRPELTAEKFIPDPWGEGARLYQTGDLARHLPGGEIEFLGRLDHQVKIRGFRIEPQELESLLRGHPQVREAVVVAREDTPGNKLLVAYVVTDGEIEHGAQALREYLRDRVPEYMLPAAVVALESLPLTPNRKVDRGALPAPEWARRSETSMLPRDEVERAIAGIWEETLGVGDCGISSNFFELGGHSLKAAVLINRVGDRFDVELPMSALFQAPTVARLSRLVRRQIGRQDEPWASGGSLVAMQLPDSQLPPLFLVHPHVGEVFAYHALARALGERPIYGLRSRGLDGGGEKPFDHIADMARHYVEQIRTVVKPGAPYYLAGWSYGGLVAYEMAKCLETAGEEVGLLAIVDTSPVERPVRPRPRVTVPQIAEMFFDLDKAGFKGLRRRQSLARILETVHDHPLLPPGTSLRRFDRLVAVMQANTVALLRYATAGRVRAELHLFQATEGSHLPDCERWRPYTEGGLHVVAIPGDHHQLFSPPAVDLVAAGLRNILAR